MAKNGFDDRIWRLFRQGKWEESRDLLEAERETDPQNHWLLTQLGVTFYEQQRYNDALKLFRASLRIVGDCPLTLWNVAGTLDALERPAEAIAVYTRLILSTKSYKDDPCWESEEWTRALKTDCMDRLGVCFRHLAARRAAARRGRQSEIGRGAIAAVKSANSVLHRMMIKPAEGRQGTRPAANREKPVGRRVAAKR